MTFEIYTDGSCLGQPAGPVGFAAIILEGNQEVHRVSGCLGQATSVQAEMLAVILGLEALTEPSFVTVYSDSQPTVHGAYGICGRRKNRDLWERLDRAAAPHRVAYLWVKGHNGNPWNHAAHTLSVEAARRAAAALKAGRLPPRVAPPLVVPGLELALEFARECLGWNDAAPPLSSGSYVKTRRVNAAGNRLYYTDLGNVLAAASAWADANAKDGVLQVDVGYLADERLYVGSVLVGEDWVQASHVNPCQALMEASVLAVLKLGEVTPEVEEASPDGTPARERGEEALGPSPSHVGENSYQQ